LGARVLSTPEIMVSTLLRCDSCTKCRVNEVGLLRGVLARVPLAVVVQLGVGERAERVRWTWTPSVRAGPARRAQIVLLADEGIELGIRVLRRCAGCRRRRIVR
jgi:hypothetical protein